MTPTGSSVGVISPGRAVQGELHRHNNGDIVSRGPRPATGAELDRAVDQEEAWQCPAAELARFGQLNSSPRSASSRPPDLARLATAANADALARDAQALSGLRATESHLWWLASAANAFDTELPAPRSKRVRLDLPMRTCRLPPTSRPKSLHHDHPFAHGHGAGALGRVVRHAIDEEHSPCHHESEESCGVTGYLSVGGVNEVVNCAHFVVKGTADAECAPTCPEPSAWRKLERHACSITTPGIRL